MIEISAQVDNQQETHAVILTTNAHSHTITMPPKASGHGSSANGGEVLFLALATCYCNDLYREAARRDITVRRVQVSVSGEFAEVPGSCAENVTYDVQVEAEASQDAIAELIRHTDTVAEIQNTLRRGTNVTLNEVEAIPV